MNLNDFLIKASRRDPENSVYQIDSAIFRKVPSVYDRAIKDSSFLEQSFPKILNRQSREGLSEIEKIPFILYPYELPFSLFKDSALFYLKVLNQLLDKNCTLKDATPFNIAYLGNQKFIHFDLGSLENFDENSGWKGYKQFLLEYYFPLMYLHENKSVYYTDLIKLNFDKQWIYQYKFKTKNFFNPSFLIHYGFIKNSAIKHLKQENGNGFKLKIAQVKRNVLLLEEGIKKLKFTANKTKWDNYYNDTVIKEGYLAKKEEAVIYFLSKINKEILFTTDWGANDGKFSNIVLEKFQTTVISIESDYQAVNQLYIKNKGKGIIPVFTDILNLSPAVGFNYERESLLERLKNVSDLQLCLGLIHHLMHQENLSFEHIINFFSKASKSKSYLIIEFIHADDPRHQLIKNPNYPYSLERDFFVNSLNQHYEILDSKSVFQTRELFFCIKRD